MIVRALPVFLVSLFSNIAFAMPAASCDDMANSLIGNANLAGLGQYDPILTVKDGKAVLNPGSDRIVSFKKEGTKTTVVFNRKIQNGSELLSVRESVDFQTNDQGYVISFMNDPKQMNGNLGQKATVAKNQSGLCSMEQFSTLMKGNGPNPTEIVNQDRKFCDSVQGLMRDMGRSSFEKCHDLLQKASQAYAKRAAELQQQQKFFVESGVVNSMMVTMTSMNNCGPDEWYQTMSTPMGVQRMLKVGAAAMIDDAPEAKTGTR